MDSLIQDIPFLVIRLLITLHLSPSVLFVASSSRFKFPTRSTGSEELIRELPLFIITPFVKSAYDIESRR